MTRSGCRGGCAVSLQALQPCRSAAQAQSRLSWQGHCPQALAVAGAQQAFVALGSAVCRPSWNCLLGFSVRELLTAAANWCGRPSEPCALSDVIQVISTTQLDRM